MVILIDISLMMSNAEPLFKDLLVNSTSSFEKCPRLLLILLGSFLLSVCGNSLHVLNMRPLSDICLANIFSQSLACFFVFLIMPFRVGVFCFGEVPLTDFYM